MGIRRRKWTGKAGKELSHLEIDVCVTLSSGARKRVRKKAIIQTRRGAEKEERQIREQLALGTWGRKEADKRTVPTVKQFSEEFLAHCRTTNRPGEMREKERTLRLHLWPELGGHQLDQLSRATIETYKRRKLERPRGPGLPPLSAKTVVNHLAVLRRMLNLAKQWGVIDDVPGFESPRPEVPDIEQNKYLDFDEAQVLVEAARSQDRGWILFAIRTGLRLGELRGLLWNALDLENRTGATNWAPSMRIGSQLTRDGPARTKGRPRTLHLADDLVELLRAQPRRGVYVFTDASGQPLTRGAIDYGVREAARRGQLDKPVHPHMLRHTFVSHSLMNGVPLVNVQAWAGHTDVKMTLRYAHLAPTASAGLIRDLAAAPQTTRLHPASTSKRSKGGA